MDVVTRNNPELTRYEVHADGKLAGFAEYNLLKGAVMFTHTEMDPAFEGKGLASRLARHAIEDVREQGKQVIPACQFIAGYLRKHPEYHDLLRPDIRKAYNI